jgi:hypothetical protein
MNNLIIRRDGCGCGCGRGGGRSRSAVREDDADADADAPRFGHRTYLCYFPCRTRVCVTIESKARYRAASINRNISLEFVHMFRRRKLAGFFEVAALGRHNLFGSTNPIGGWGRPFSTLTASNRNVFFSFLLPTNPT